MMSTRSWIALALLAPWLVAPRAHADGRLASAGELVAPADARTLAPSSLPAPKGACPPFREGPLRVADVEVHALAVGKRGKGPLILYWHGTDSSPERELDRGLGGEMLARVRKQGGLVIGMIAGQVKGLNTSGNGVWSDADMAVADEVVACALAQDRVDPRRIHVLGMSAGGLQTAAFAYRRSNYVASVVTYSGGHVVYNGRVWTDRRAADPNNHFAALILHGGADDVVGMSFEAGGRSFRDELSARGHPVWLCNHGGGHVIPQGAGTLAMRFFEAHPFATTESALAERFARELSALCPPE